MGTEFTLPHTGFIIRDGAKLIQEALTLYKCDDMMKLTTQKLTSRTQFTREFLADQLTKVLQLAEKQQAYIVQFDKVANEIFFIKYFLKYYIVQQGNRIAEYQR